MSLLGEHIRAERTQRKWTQDELASQIGTGMNKQRLSAIERGHAMPTMAQLIRIGELFALTDNDNMTWLLQWLHKEVHDANDGHETDTPYLKTIETVLQHYHRDPMKTRAGGGLSLEDFPSAFEPITVVLGDRRESRPATRGDLLAYSIATTDVIFLERLGLNQHSTTIKSDKLFVLMDDAYLRQTFGQTHLLVVGSPALNHATRLVNRGSIFRFDLDPDLVAWEDKLRAASYLNDKRALDAFFEIIHDPSNRVSFRNHDIHGLSSENVDHLISLAEQLMGDNDPKSLMARFRNPGLVDPADGRIHGTYTRRLNDFGILSLGLNPFAETEDYVCILIAGIHGPGTAHAMRALAEKQDWHGGHIRDRPLGGIIEVQLDEFKDWPTRFEKADWEWQTNPYTAEKVMQHLQQEWHQKQAGQEGTFTKKWSLAEIEAALHFVRRLIGAADSHQQHRDITS